MGESMKKNIFKTFSKIVCLLLLIFVAISFSACKKKKEVVIDNINNHIIESRNAIFAGSNDEFFATFCVGEREEPYALDGVVNEKVPFGIVTFSRRDNKPLLQDSYDFSLTLNGETLTGSLEKSPYDNTYSADVGKSVGDDAEISLVVNGESVNFSETLFNESKNFQVNISQAISIAGEELKDVISEMLNTEGNSCEAMVKIMKDYSSDTNKYYWYVGMVCSDGKTAGILIDTTTGEIISKKV